MDDARKQVLMAELEDATRERDQLTIYIDTLAARLGITAVQAEATPDDQGSRGNAGPADGKLTDDVEALIYANEFFGMTMPKAAETVLDRWSPEPYKRPIKTPELVRALRKGGIEIKESRVLYRSLYATSRFTNLKGGQWGFTKWYPNGGRSKGGKPAEEETDAPEVAVDSPPATPQSPAENAGTADQSEEGAS